MSESLIWPLVLSGFAVFFGLGFLISWAECKATGIFQLYRRYKHDSSDRILTRTITFWGELNVLLHRKMLRIGIGEKCIHLSFYALPVLFKGTASIPWREVELISSLEDSLLPIGRTAEFRFGPDRFFLRLRGGAARAVQDRLKALPHAI